MSINLAAVADTRIDEKLVVTNLVKDYFVAQGVVDADRGLVDNQAALLLAVSALEQRVNALMNVIRVSDKVTDRGAALLDRMRDGSLPDSIG